MNTCYTWTTEKWAYIFLLLLSSVLWHTSKPSRKNLIVSWVYGSLKYTNKFPISSELYIYWTVLPGSVNIAVKITSSTYSSIKWVWYHLSYCVRFNWSHECIQRWHVIIIWHCYCLLILELGLLGQIRLKGLKKLVNEFKPYLKTQKYKPGIKHLIWGQFWCLI